MTNKTQDDGISILTEESVEQVEEPKPAFIEQAAMAMITLGIGIAIVPFAVKFLTGMRSMSSIMGMIAIFGVVILALGVVLTVISKSKAAK